MVRGTLRECYFKINIDLQTNTKRGGQSANRIARIRDEKRILLLGKIREKIKEVKGGCSLSDIYVGGIGTFYLEVAKDLRTNKVFIAEYLEELIEKSALLQEDEVINMEKRELQKFNELLSRNPDLLLFGKKEVIMASREYLVRKIIIGKDMEGLEEKFGDNSPAEIIRLSHVSLSGYGGIVAIKWN